jgi:hypothetical protein
MKTTEQLSHEDFQEAHDDETSSRTALALLVVSAVVVGSTFAFVWLLSMVTT